MTIKDNEADYINETTEELRARVCMYLMYAQVQNAGYEALRSYGVNYKDLPEWKDNKAIDLAMKLKPTKSQEIVVNWLIRVENAIKAAVRRKQLVGLTGGRPPETTKH